MADADLVRAAGFGHPDGVVFNDHQVIAAVVTVHTEGGVLVQGIGPHHGSVLGDLDHPAGLSLAI